MRVFLKSFLPLPRFPNTTAESTSTKHFIVLSSVLIAAEREQRPVNLLLAALSEEFSEAEFLLSSITVRELEHGWHRGSSMPITPVMFRQNLGVDQKPGHRISTDPGVITSPIEVKASPDEGRVQQKI